MREPRVIVQAARKLAEAGDQAEALSLVRGGFDADTDFAILARAAKWAASVQWQGRRSLRVAWLGGGTLEHCRDFTAFWALLEGLGVESYLPSYDTWRMEILNPESGLYRFRPEVAWLFTHWRDAGLATDPGLNASSAAARVDEVADRFADLWRTLAEYLPGTQIVQNTFDPPPHEVFGNYAATLPGSAANLIRRMNLALASRAPAAGVILFDFERLALHQGLSRWHNPSYWFHSKHPFAPEFSGRVGFHCARLLASLKGTAKKALVLDLDNTLWGGVIGDDGLEGIRLGMGPDGEAFAAFQEYILGLARRGVVLAVASKNEESTAREPFLTHPDMRLRLEDIAVFAANWRNKADNIRHIAETLNLGLDAFVFVDDNPAERELIRRELPMVAVPELPAEPADYIRVLESHAYFETVSHSAEDAGRGRMYRENAQRAEAKASVTSLDEYLMSLEMVADSGPADEFHLPRMAQLINKSNQFNLTGARCTEARLRELAARNDHIVRWFSLRDRFGDYGLISVVVLRRAGDAFIIDTWVMSCRVLERGMEAYIAFELANVARNAAAAKLRGVYVPTAKNTLVEALYERLEFQKRPTHAAGEWELDIASGAPEKPSFITRKERNVR